MNINEYQKQASETAIYQDKVIYPTLGLAGEAGEIANKVKKILRDSSGEIQEEVRQNLISELGDILWYVAALATDLRAELSEVANKNIEKLNSRKNRGVIGGNGDNR
jgi:NTP pyrophosphatase (non-canonical NTP hydrolase)